MNKKLEFDCKRGEIWTFSLRPLRIPLRTLRLKKREFNRKSSLYSNSSTRGISPSDGS